MPEYNNFVLRPRIDGEVMTPDEAKDRLGVCPRTLFTYGVKLPICRKIGKDRAFSRVAVEMLRDGDAEALALYGNGDRRSPQVRQYYSRLNIALPDFLVGE